MPRFAIRRIKEVEGKQNFYKLIIDDISVVDEFENGLESQYEEEKDSLYFVMHRLSALESVRETDYKPRKDLHDAAFEIKSKHLRYYGMKVEKTGKVIIICGFKNMQKKDERKINGLIKQCIDNHVIEKEKTDET